MYVCQELQSTDLAGLHTACCQPVSQVRSSTHDVCNHLQLFSSYKLLRSCLFISITAYMYSCFTGCDDGQTLRTHSLPTYTVFHKIGTPLYFCNNILPCGPISIIDIPNCSAENWLKTSDTFTYLTFIYYFKIVMSHPRQYLRVADI